MGMVCFVSCETKKGYGKCGVLFCMKQNTVIGNGYRKGLCLFCMKQKDGDWTCL
jgi:hypothetical protein